MMKQPSLLQLLLAVLICLSSVSICTTKNVVVEAAASISSSTSSTRSEDDNDNNSNSNSNSETSSPSSSTSSKSSSSSHSSSTTTWNDCNVFIAPSIVTNFGWGVFAGRNFEEQEIIEIAPLVIPMNPKRSLIQHSILQDYVYGYYRINFSKQILEMYNGILFGTTMYANHQPQPNVVFTTFGREPVPEMGIHHAINAMGLVATRTIESGEELFGFYGNDDTGTEWFEDRGEQIQIVTTIEQSQIKPLPHLQEIMSKYCSNIYAGIGRPTWNKGVLDILPKDGTSIPFWMNDTSRLSPIDAGLHHGAIAKNNVQIGERLEIGPAFVVSLQMVQGTPIAPFAMTWLDLINHDDQYRIALEQLRQDKELTVQYQGQSTNWLPIDRFTSFQDLVLLPVAGNIGLIRRVGGTTISTKSNCRLIIHYNSSSSSKKKDEEEEENKEEYYEFDGLGVTLEIVATQTLQAGDVLLLDLPPPTVTKMEKQALIHELKLSGQSYWDEEDEHDDDDDDVSSFDKEL